MNTNVQMLEDVSRALGLAEALAHPFPKVRPGSTEAVAEEIIVLLQRVRGQLFEASTTGFV